MKTQKTKMPTTLQMLKVENIHRPAAVVAAAASAAAAAAAVRAMTIANDGLLVVD